MPLHLVNQPLALLGRDAGQNGGFMQGRNVRLATHSPFRFLTLLFFYLITGNRQIY